MPRLTPQLIRRANRLSPHLATLLPACKDLTSASNELRWLKEHVDQTGSHDKHQHLSELCRRRGRGVPLQYVLGSQPFGSLDIRCKPGVLIPRPETEAYTYHLAELIKSGRLLDSKTKALSIVDFCTGTGCIPLSLFSALQSDRDQLAVTGVDISPTALHLARINYALNVKNGSTQRPTGDQSLRFEKADVFDDAIIQGLAASAGHVDLMISNPPYISKDTWAYGRGNMGFSVRKYEPKLALVPGDHLPRAPEGLAQEDVFYARFLDIAALLKPSALFLEIGDEGQALRVAKFSHSHAFSEGKDIEIWRDWPESEVTTLLDLGGHCKVRVRGEGNMRAVLLKTSS